MSPQPAIMILNCFIIFPPKFNLCKNDLRPGSRPVTGMLKCHMKRFMASSIGFALAAWEPPSVLARYAQDSNSMLAQPS